MNKHLVDGWVENLKEMDQIGSLVEHQIACYHKHTHEHGVELTKLVEEANVINRATGATL